MSLSAAFGTLGGFRFPIKTFGAGYRHLIIDLMPVIGDEFLCLLERNFTITDLIMQVIFNPVFFMEAGARIG